MNILNNQLVDGSEGKPILWDLFYPDDGNTRALIIFVHGFKGFKDWGHWKKLGAGFVDQGLAFMCFNFSHNGTSPSSPLTFSDLPAFGDNNFSRELFDLNTIIDLVRNGDSEMPASLNGLPVFLVGHSRGGAISLIQALEDERINGVITWASVARLDYAWRDTSHLARWKEKGVQYILNGRTFQEMPLYYQLYEDFIEHKERFDIPGRIGNMEKPWLIVHGDKDPSVALDHAYRLHEVNSTSTLKVIAGADHVFNGRHPFEDSQLPGASEQLLSITVDFINQHCV